MDLKTISSFLSKVVEQNNSSSPPKETQKKTKTHTNISLIVLISLVLGYIIVITRYRELLPDRDFTLIFSIFLSLSTILTILAFTSKTAKANNIWVSASVYCFGLCMFFIAFSIKSTFQEVSSIEASFQSLLVDVDYTANGQLIQMEVAQRVGSIGIQLEDYIQMTVGLTQASIMSIIYCNAAFQLVYQINWLNTSGFLAFGSIQLYLLVKDSHSISMQIAFMVQFLSVFFALLSFKYYFSFIKDTLIQKSKQLWKIEEFYHKWTLNLGLGYCLIKEDKVIFSNKEYSSTIKSPTDLKVHSSFVSGLNKGVGWTEMLKIISSMKDLEFAKVAILSIENKYFECRLGKYPNDFLELFLSDITHSVQQERKKVEEKYRNTVFAKIAHEFKTPIANIVLLIEKIKDKVTDPSVRNELNMMKGLSDYTTFLVSDITSYFNSGTKLKIVPELTNLCEVCEFAFNVLSSLLDVKSSLKRGVKAKLQCSSSIYVMIDQIRLKQVLLNLISNAAKFSLHGTICLSCEEIQDNIVLSVSDEGVGIPQYKLDQLRNNEDLKFEVRDEYNNMGSGLGISICKQICAEMKVSFEIESREKQGTTVKITIPKEEFTVEPETNLTAQTIEFVGPYTFSREEVDQCPSAVLVVEDNSIIRRSLRVVIEKISKTFNKEWTVLEVEDGIFGLSEVVNLSLSGTKIEFMVTDEFMDFLNGSDTVKILTNLMENRKINEFPCISCSAFEDDNFLEKIRESGVCQILPKPGSFESLVALLKSERII